MTAVRITEAAACLGFKSRSSLYRLLRDGALKGYLRRGPDGVRLLELDPPGLPSLAAAVAGLTRPRIDRLRRPVAAAPGPACFWREWGRWRPSEALSPAAAEDHAGAMVAALLGEPLNGGLQPRHWLAHVEALIAEARGDVAAGARWDPERWDRANAVSLLPAASGGCEASRTELLQLLADHRVPNDLLHAARQALARD